MKEDLRLKDSQIQEMKDILKEKLQNSERKKSNTIDKTQNETNPNILQQQQEEKQYSYLQEGEKPSCFVVELFAGSFPVARAMQKPEIQQKWKIVGYAAIEIEKEFSELCPTPSLVGLEEENMLNLCGSITDPEIQNVFLSFCKERMNALKPNAVLFLGGPSCTMYSQATVGNSKAISENYSLFQKKVDEADKLVLATLSLYESVEHDIKSLQGKAFLFFENPWSRSKLRIFYQGRTYNHLLGLQYRPFLQKFFAKNGGYLYIAYNCSCAYDKTYPKKPTAVFTNIFNFPQKPCICPRRNRKVIHKKNIQTMNSKHEKAKWPIEVVFLFFDLSLYKTILRQFNDKVERNPF